VLVVAVIGGPALAGPSSTADRCGPAENPEEWVDYGGTPDIALSPELGLSVVEVEQLLSRISAADYAERVDAALQLKRDASGSEQAFREVLWSKHGARNTEIRTAVREARRRLKRKATADDSGLLGVLLEMDPAEAEIGNGTRVAARIMAILVALRSLNTMAGYKVMLDFSLRHAGAFRQEIGAMMVASGLDALPALIYGRGSKSEELHMFAVKWIRDMGNPLLGDQIRGIKNPRRLAQLLEAYASVNELDAVDVTVSLTNHDSIFVRKAARKCLESYGVNAKWTLKRTYENTFSREPPESGGVESWREELYAHYDQARIAPAMGMFKRGLKHAEQDQLEEMERLFRQVLRDEPMFPRRHEMAPGFLELAARFEENEQLSQARAMSLLALRVADPRSAEHGRAQASLKWIEAEVNRRGGAVDLELYEQISRMDPDHDEASGMADDLAAGGPGFGKLGLKAAVIALFVFLAAVLVVRRIGVR
jgi:hypothetical protein